MNKGFGNIMKQAQMMQQKMQRLQQELEGREVEATSGGGMVTAKVNGKQQLLGLKIEPAAVDAEDIEMLEDLIIAAFNESVRKAAEAMEKGMEAAKGNLSVPGLF